MIGGYYKVVFSDIKDTASYTYRSAIKDDLEDGMLVIVEVKRTGMLSYAIGRVIGLSDKEECNRFKYVSHIVKIIDINSLYDVMHSANKEFDRVTEQINVLKNL